MSSKDRRRKRECHVRAKIAGFRFPGHALGRPFIPELGKSLFAKRFLEDPETGVTVRLVKYPAGFTNTWHTHPCAHGMYVLEGTLVTHDGAFGPGNFIWFAEGMTMQHGATQTQDVTVLFLTNKKFEIHYTQGANGSEKIASN